MDEILQELDDIKTCTEITEEVDPRDFIKVVEILGMVIKKLK